MQRANLQVNNNGNAFYQLCTCTFRVIEFEVAIMYTASIKTWVKIDRFSIQIL